MDAAARREARKQRLLERGEDRLQQITGVYSSKGAARTVASQAVASWHGPGVRPSTFGAQAGLSQVTAINWTPQLPALTFKPLRAVGSLMQSLQLYQQHSSSPPLAVAHT